MVLLISPVRFKLFAVGQESDEGLSIFFSYKDYFLVTRTQHEENVSLPVPNPLFLVAPALLEAVGVFPDGVLLRECLADAELSQYSVSTWRILMLLCQCFLDLLECKFVAGTAL